MIARDSDRRRNLALIVVVPAWEILAGKKWRNLKVAGPVAFLLAGTQNQPSSAHLPLPPEVFNFCLGLVGAPGLEPGTR